MCDGDGEDHTVHERFLYIFKIENPVIFPMKKAKIIKI